MSQLIRNKLVIQTPPELLNSTVICKLPTAIIAAVLAHHTPTNLPFIHFESSPTTRTSIHIGITANKRIYVGDVMVGFYDIYVRGERGDEKAFIAKCASTNTIPYYFFSNKTSTKGCMVSIYDMYHNERLPFGVYKGITAQEQPSSIIATLTS